MYESLMYGKTKETKSTTQKRESGDANRDAAARSRPNGSDATDDLAGRTEKLRLRALRDFEILDSEREPLFDQFATTAAFLSGLPLAAITLIDSDRQWVKAAHGFSATEIPRDQSFCTHVVALGSEMVVRDAREDWRFRDLPSVRGLEGGGIRFYAGVPLVTDEGFVLGTLCVFDVVPRELGPSELHALRVLARSVMELLSANRTRRMLARLAEMPGAVIAENEFESVVFTNDRFSELFDRAIFSLDGLSDAFADPAEFRRRREELRVWGIASEGMTFRLADGRELVADYVRASRSERPATFAWVFREADLTKSGETAA